MGSTKRTTIRLSDERQLLVKQAKKIVAESPADEPPTSDVIDAALTHFIESEENSQNLRDELPPTTIQRFNTSALGLRYRTAIESQGR